MVVADTALFPVEFCNVYRNARDKENGVARVGDQDVIVEACTRLGPPRLYFAGVETAVRRKNRACTRADCGSRAARRA